MAAHYKVWLQIERADIDGDGEEDSWENLDWPINLLSTESYPEAHRFMRALATMFNAEENGDYAFPLEDVADPFEEDSEEDENA